MIQNLLLNKIVFVLAFGAWTIIAFLAGLFMGYRDWKKEWPSFAKGPCGYPGCSRQEEHYHNDAPFVPWPRKDLSK